MQNKTCTVLVLIALTLSLFMTCYFIEVFTLGDNKPFTMLVGFFERMMPSNKTLQRVMVRSSTTESLYSLKFHPLVFSIGFPSHVYVKRNWSAIRWDQDDRYTRVHADYYEAKKEKRKMNWHEFINGL